MALFSMRDAADALDDLLDRERSLILAGKFDVLGRLLKEKERLLAGVGELGSANRLKLIRAKVERNQAMLLAASQGIRAVSDKLAKRVRNSESFQTYDRQGQRHGRALSGNKLERRA